MSRLHLKIDDLLHVVRIPEGSKLSFDAEVVARVHNPGDHPREPSGSRVEHALRFECERVAGNVIALEETSRGGSDAESDIGDTAPPTEASIRSELYAAMTAREELEHTLAELKLIDEAKDAKLAEMEKRFGELGEMHAAELESTKNAFAEQLAGLETALVEEQAKTAAAVAKIDQSAPEADEKAEAPKPPATQG